MTEPLIEQWQGFHPTASLTRVWNHKANNQWHVEARIKGPPDTYPAYPQATADTLHVALEVLRWKIDEFLRAPHFVSKTGTFKPKPPILSLSDLAS